MIQGRRWDLEIDTTVKIQSSAADQSRKRSVAKVKISERKFNRYQRGFPARYYAEKTSLNQVCETGQIIIDNVFFCNKKGFATCHSTCYSQTQFPCHQVRRRRPDTRLNLQYDKLYVNNVAYWFNEDTEEIELVNQSDGDIESQVCGHERSTKYIFCVLSKYFCGWQ